MLIRYIKRQIIRRRLIDDAFRSLLNNLTIHVRLTNWDDSITIASLRKYVLKNSVVDTGITYVPNDEAKSGDPLIVPSDGSILFKCEDTYMLYKEVTNHGKENTPTTVIHLYALKKDKETLDELFISLRGPHAKLPTLYEVYDRMGVAAVRNAGVIHNYHKENKPAVTDSNYDSVDAIFKKFSQGRKVYQKEGNPYKETILLSGPPGTGKTSLVRHMAAKYGYNLCTGTPDIFQSSCVFKRSRPTILLLEDICRFKSLQKPDEADPKRTARENTNLNGIMNFLSGVIEIDNLIVIVTANNPEKLVPALIRPGRIDHKFHLGYMPLEDFVSRLGWTDEKLTQHLKDNFDTTKLVASHLKSFANCHDIESIDQAISAVTLVTNGEEF